MKLGVVRDRIGYCAEGRAVGTWRPDEGFTARGTVPNPASGLDRIRFDVLNAGVTKRLLRPVTGTYTTTNVWPIGDDRMLVTVGRWLFHSRDGGRSWHPVHELPRSSGPMGVLPTSLCERDDALYLAEYPLGDHDARVLISRDGGRTWSTYLVRPEVRHFHGLFDDPYGDRLWGTTGDTDDESAVGFFVEGEFRPVGMGSQHWRAVQLAFTPDAVMWGMDCPYTERVRIFRLPRSRIGEPDPEPDCVGVTDASVYYVETLAVDGETVVVAATAAEAGADSTAPGIRKRNQGSRTATVLAASSATDYEVWRELCSFERRATVGEWLSAVPTSSAYVFIATDPDLGLLVNPFNTRRKHGEIIRISHADVERLTAEKPGARVVRESRAS